MPDLALVAAPLLHMLTGEHTVLWFQPILSLAIIRTFPADYSGFDWCNNKR